MRRSVDGVPDCIACAEGLSKVLRDGHPVPTDLSFETLERDACVTVSSAAVNKPEINGTLCLPSLFAAMPSIAYMLAKVAAGDGAYGVSLYPVSAHDVAAGYALLRWAGGILLDENGQAIEYTTEVGMQAVSQRCFGGSVSACQALVSREWGRVFTDSQGDSSDGYSKGEDQANNVD